MARIPSASPAELPADVAPLAGDPFYGILARRPEILREWSKLDTAFFGASSTVDNRIKEEARRTLAQGVGCRFCASLGTPRDEHPDAREALAVAFAELVATDHHQIDDSTFAVLREEFSDEEIVELVSWICFKLGSNIFGALMKLAPATPAEVDGYAAFVAGDLATH
ncbi:carboxymuconolactone decarboxylase family protein [Nakamurella deserti]|uniref:carboxymuconolactone decarboxylase family protein n=1 Tax=Nakamurella deserti TaxID=2164074 RepID=UPI000DBEA5C5|nr:carboxymuconolactone decarboxylase family protein [Nakamurella deserti]